MARHIVTYPSPDPIALINAIGNYLTATEGYEYVMYKNESVFKKGDGWVSGPTFFKFTPIQGGVCMETWMKYAILPGVFVGEIELKGMVGAAVKGPWKRRIACIESIVAQAVPQPQYQQPVQPPFAPQGSDNFRG